MPATPVAQLHPQLTRLAALLGKWAGEGEGEYPTVDRFGYGEEITFSHTGKAFIAYTQRTWHSEDGRPLHSEMGYLKCPSPDRVELVLAHPTGHVEVSEGSLRDGSIVLRSTAILRTDSAKPVEEIVRRIDVSGDRMDYELEMAAVSVALCPHLRGTLRRVSPH